MELLHKRQLELAIYQIRCIQYDVLIIRVIDRNVKMKQIEEILQFTSFKI